MTMVKNKTSFHNVDVLKDLQTYAEDVIREYDIPAISLAVWKENTLHQAAAGILNLNTGVTATTDSIFQIGSITKVMTTCLVMQLVDEGKVELDKPVKTYLRDFQVADEEATHRITVRQLLNHTSGMAGDYFPDDLNDQGNLIARYVDRCSLLPLAHPVGKLSSYSNSGFAVAGRLVEVVRGISWYQAMRDYVYQPLGMHHAIAEPRDMIYYRTAIGHVQGDKGEWKVPEQAYLTLGHAPVGSTPMMTAHDLMTFARAHLDEGKSQTGQRWLSPAAIAAMQASEVLLPKHSQVGDHFAGLGWRIATLHNGTRIVSHNGATMGFLSSLQVIPSQNTAFAILINGYNRAVIDLVTETLMAGIAGLDIREPEVNHYPLSNDAIQRYVGTYDSMDRRIDIRCDNQQLNAHIVYKIDPLPPENAVLTPLGEDMFAVYNAQGKRGKNVAFVQDDSGNEMYLLMASRLQRKLAQ